MCVYKLYTTVLLKFVINSSIGRGYTQIIHILFNQYDFKFIDFTY